MKKELELLRDYLKKNGYEDDSKRVEEIMHDITKADSENAKGSIIFLMGLAPNVLGYRHPAAILDRSKNKCCGLITDGEELKNNQPELFTE